ncbi:Niemann-Pick C1 protein-like protein [Leptotrombidium deliense]|uniref:Niemann-Pick C1 protein-like protein n=1 Tax=Leptotrombidium deliense TaxID=299467 RepID=A0A443S122_9ACAR|nr:Niemann-Pick C1 protein-like protein [Leptotrombidium deliense]
MCDKKGFGPVPCAFTGAPDPLTDDEAKAAMKEMCPHLASEAALCCDKDQILEMRSSFEIYGLFLKKCPSCFLNYQKIFCHLYCSPKQNTFAKVLNTTKSEEGKDQIQEIDYFVHNDFVKGIYESCKGVTRFGLKIIDVFCKPWSAEKCNQERMLKYLGADDEHLGHHPFQIDFVFTDKPTYTLGSETFTAANEMTYKCSESANGQPKCECAHCKAAC